MDEQKVISNGLEPKAKPVEQAPVPVTEQHATDANVTTSQPETQSVANEDARAVNKMSQLERERNDAKKRAEELERQYAEEKAQREAIQRELNSTFETDPEAYKAFAKAYNKMAGRDVLPSFEEKYGRREQPKETPTQQMPTTDVVVNQAVAQLEAKTAFEQFIADHPDVDPVRAEDKSGTQAKLEKVTKLADFYISSWGMKPGDALKEAYLSMPENRGKAMESAKEEGELAAKARGLSRGVADSSAPSSGGAPVIPHTDAYGRLNNSQKKRYDELVAKNPRVAEIYVQKILGN